MQCRDHNGTDPWLQWNLIYCFMKMTCIHILNASWPVFVLRSTWTIMTLTFNTIETSLSMKQSCLLGDLFSFSLSISSALYITIQGTAMFFYDLDDLWGHRPWLQPCDIKISMAISLNFSMKFEDTDYDIPVSTFLHNNPYDP